MRFKKMLVALFACMALTAVAANAAQAVQWQVGAVEGPGTGTPITSESVATSGGPWTLSAFVSGASIVLHATAIGCEGCTISGEGASAGKLVFTGVTVTPSTCTINSPGKATGTIVTNSVKGQAEMSGESVIDRFSPAPGTKFVELEFNGPSCPLAEIVMPISGTAVGIASHATGFLAKEPEITFNSASGSALRAGTGAATLEGIGKYELSGANAAKPFGIG